MIKKPFAASFLALSFVLTPGLVACTSIPVDPCSKAGVEYRLSKTLSAFARSNRSDISDVRQASQFIGGETTFGAMKLAFAVTTVKRLVENFSADVVPEIEDIALQCGTTQNIQEVFLDLLRDEGVSPKMIDRIAAVAVLLEQTDIE